MFVIRPRVIVSYKVPSLFFQLTNQSVSRTAKFKNIGKEDIKWEPERNTETERS